MPVTDVRRMKKKIKTLCSAQDCSESMNLTDLNIFFMKLEGLVVKLV